MPVTVLDLGELQLKSKDTKQSLLLATSMTLDVPPMIAQQIDVEHLAEMTRTGQLWVSKASNCQLEVSASLQEVEVLGPNAISTLPQVMVDTMGGCPIWEDLSLTLRREAPKNPSQARPDAYTSYIINHPDLSSDILSPSNAPCLRLLRITCDLCYGLRPRRKPTEKPAKRRKIEVPERSQVQAEFGLRRRPMASYAQDDTDDEQQDTKEGRLAHKAPTLQSHDSGIGLGSQETVESQTEGRAPQTLQADAVLLTETALSKLLGIKTATARVRIRDRLVLPLIELAPAVFNIRYLQAFTSRAVHIPSIASCLANLDAESPGLRAKLRRLGQGDSDSDAAVGLENRLHMLIQRGLDVSPIAPSKRRTASDAIEQQEDVAQQAKSMLENDTQQSWGQDTQGSEQPDLAGAHIRLETGSHDSHLNTFQQMDKDAEEGSTQRRQPPTRLSYTNGGQQRQYAGIPFEQRQQYFQDPNSPELAQQQCDIGIFETTIGIQPPQSGNEWLDLSQARYILDEHGQRIALDDLEGEEEYEYELVPLGSDDHPVL